VNLRGTQRRIRYPEGVECVNCYNRVWLW
jgi:hypothetical protein